jgi:hypothetical protein
MIVYFTLTYGAVGGGLAWLLLNSVYLLFGTWLTHRYLLKGMALEWLIRDVGAPLCISLFVILGGWQLIHTDGNRFVNLLLGCGLALIASLVCVSVLLGPKVKNILWKLDSTKT